jgi:hypothetical protein
MEGWVDAARANRKLSDAFPVKGVTADKKHADLLARRLGTLRDEIIPQIELQIAEAARTLSKRK